MMNAWSPIAAISAAAVLRDCISLAGVRIAAGAARHVGSWRAVRRENENS